MSSHRIPTNGTRSHKMTDEERRQAIGGERQRKMPLVRLTEGQGAHIGEVEREMREAHAKARQRRQMLPLRP